MKKRTSQSKRYFSISNIAALLCFLIILFLCMSGAYMNLTNADNTSYPYLFQTITHSHDVTLPSEHTNLAKFPLFFAQSILPYNPVTHVMANGLLLFATFAGLYYVVRHIFGSTFALSFSMFVTAFLLFSPNLLYWLSGNTSRNIEYPILLLFIWNMLELLKSHKTKFTYFLSAALLAVAAAGDSLILYLAAFAIVGTVAHRWLTDSLPGRPLDTIKLLAYLFSPIALGLLLRSGLQILGINLYKDTSFELHTIPYDSIGPTLAIAIKDFLSLVNANVFGETIGVHTGVKFVSLLLIVTSIGIIFHSLLRLPKIAPRLQNADIFLAICSTLCIVIAGLYVFSGLASVIDQSGQLVSSGAIRYLTVLPILFAILNTSYLRRYWKKLLPHRTKLLVITSILTLIALPGIAHSYRSFFHTQKQQHILIDTVAQHLEDENVDTVVSGYWYSTTTRLFAERHLQTASAYCTARGPLFNVALSDYSASSHSKKSALIISRQGMDAMYWTSCSESILLAAYGAPVSREQLTQGPDTVELWIFDYNILPKIQLSP